MGFHLRTTGSEVGWVEGRVVGWDLGVVDLAVEVWEESAPQPVMKKSRRNRVGRCIRGALVYLFRPRMIEESGVVGEEPERV
jgi:hypothetical protein